MHQQALLLVRLLDLLGARLRIDLQESVVVVIGIIGVSAEEGVAAAEEEGQI